jgi:hypothetical protein
LALIAEIQAGTFHPTWVPISQLQVTNQFGTFFMSNYYYLSDESAATLATILGGTVQQANPSNAQSSAPLANYIVLNPATGPQLICNAAVLASYAAGRNTPATQLAFDLTAAINQSTAVAANGGNAIMFPLGWGGPAIPGFTYPPGQPVDGAGNLINPAMVF